MTREAERRAFLAYLSSIGLGTTLFPGVLWARAQQARGGAITLAMIEDAAKLSGLDLTGAEQETILEGVNRNVARYREIAQTPLPNSVPLPLHFDPRVSREDIPEGDATFDMGDPTTVVRPRALEEVAFWPVTHLSELIRTGQVSSEELATMYLERLERFHPTLNCVVNRTSDLAMELARRADAELASGHRRGPLHGIPWGVKDIVSVRGYPTTWGAAPFENRTLDVNATVVDRLTEAGAVLVAKLTTGELAFGDRWFGGRTRNPWDPEQGSSGSSAGSASATAAGLVGFAIGTDTGGSILAPSVRCGVVGVRPTFGRVSRYGVMAAGFSLDRIGSMCRTAEDCALVLNAIIGPDGKDLAVVENAPFRWNARDDVTRLRVGYTQSLFDNLEDAATKANNETALAELRALGVTLSPVVFPESDINFFIEYTERGAGFDEFLRQGLDAGLVRTRHRAELRVAQLVPAVEYLQANRARFLLMQEVARAMEPFDVIVAPHPTLDPKTSINPITSLTGHPAMAIPNGFNDRDRPTPTGFTFVGRLYREGDMLLLAKAYQDRVRSYERHPELSQ